MEVIFLERRLYGYYYDLDGVGDHMFDRGDASGGAGESYFEKDTRA